MGQTHLMVIILTLYVWDKININWQSNSGGHLTFKDTEMNPLWRQF